MVWHAACFYYSDEHSTSYPHQQGTARNTTESISDLGHSFQTSHVPNWSTILNLIDNQPIGGARLIIFLIFIGQGRKGRKDCLYLMKNLLTKMPLQHFSLSESFIKGAPEYSLLGRKGCCVVVLHISVKELVISFMLVANELININHIELTVWTFSSPPS